VLDWYSSNLCCSAIVHLWNYPSGY